MVGNGLPFGVPLGVPFILATNWSRKLPAGCCSVAAAATGGSTYGARAFVACFEYDAAIADIFRGTRRPARLRPFVTGGSVSHS